MNQTFGKLGGDELEWFHGEKGVDHTNRKSLLELLKNYLKLLNVINTRIDDQQNL